MQIVRSFTATGASETDGALFPRQPAGGDERLQRGDGLRPALIVHPDGRVVLQVAADPRQVVVGRDPQRLQLVRRADPGAKQNQRRAVRARGEDHPVGGDMG